MGVQSVNAAIVNVQVSIRSITWSVVTATLGMRLGSVYLATKCSSVQLLSCSLPPPIEPTPTGYDCKSSRAIIDSSDNDVIPIDSSDNDVIPIRVTIIHVLLKLYNCILFFLVLKVQKAR